MKGEKTTVAKQRPTYLPFEEARTFVQRFAFKNRREWCDYYKSGNKPDNIPSAPQLVYKEDFKGYGDWLGNGNTASHLRTYLPFEEARGDVHILQLTNVKEWQDYCKSGNKPDTIPAAPERVYKEDFKGYGDWLGTGTISARNRKYIPFEEARAYIRALELKGTDEWVDYCRSGNKPDTIPSAPQLVYKEDFKGLGDWLGTGNVHPSFRIYLPFEEARACIHALEFKNKEDWFDYCKSGNKPANLPAKPEDVYKEDFRGYGDWLGSGTIAYQNRTYLPFEEARAFVQRLDFKNNGDWRDYCKSGNKPENIPTAPEQVYKEDFKSYGDWLGTGSIHYSLRTYLPFEEARTFIRMQGLKNDKDWRDYCRSGKRPMNIPTHPHSIYKGDFKGWGDWLGVVNLWTKTALLALLYDLRPRLEQLESSELYIILQQGGAFPGMRKALGNASLMQVLADLKENAGQGIEQGLSTIAEDEDLTLNNDNLADDDIIAETDGVTLTDQVTEISPLAADAQPLPGLPLQEHLHIIDLLAELSCGLDDTAVEYLVGNRVATLWKVYITQGHASIDGALADSGGYWYNEIHRRFLAELDGVKHVAIPVGWTYKNLYGKPAQPNAMQKRTAWAIRERRRVGNWSGVGSGKTLAAILASRVIDAHLTLVVTNGATVSGWKREIHNAYSDSVIIEQLAMPLQDQHNYIVLNYEKFQQANRNALVHQLLDMGIDFIIFDEVQFVKQRDAVASYRRETLAALVCEAERRNPALCVLGMSATPVINNLQEAKKLLEIVTGLQFSELQTVPTINNALAMHCALLLHGFRYVPYYEQEMHEQIVLTTRNDLLEDLQKAKGSVLQVEQVLLEAKLDAIRDKFSPGTLVYAHYVDGVIAEARNYIERLGYSVGLYMGADKSGYEPFCNGKIDILLGTSPVGTGLDGLQKVCNRVIFLILPWTSAEYEQIIGRVRRQGSAFGEVEVIIPQVYLEHSGNAWSWDAARMECITFKRTLSDCVRDGTIPQCIHMNPTALLAQSRNALEQWITRVEVDGLYTIDRAKLTIPLPVDVHTLAQRRYGDFSVLNNRWNNAYSVTTHERLETNPTEWYLYHTLYHKARVCWPEEPVKRIAEKLQARPDWVIGDFGCGECLLQGILPGVQVIGIDHVACNETVIACDMAHTPLADSELDVAVFSLSLMGANWGDYLQEASRTLKVYGHICIAEAASRWQGKQDTLVDALREASFVMLGDIEQHYDFLYITAIKLPDGCAM